MVVVGVEDELSGPLVVHVLTGGKQGGADAYGPFKDVSPSNGPDPSAVLAGGGGGVVVDLPKARCHTPVMGWRGTKPLRQETLCATPHLRFAVI